MTKQFAQIHWDELLEDDCRQIVRLAVREDLQRQYDWTTLALVAEDSLAQAAMVARQGGVIAGLPVVNLVLNEMDIQATWTPLVDDGACVKPATPLGHLAGPSRHLLTAERLLLNFVGRLSGIATLTARYVAAISGVGQCRAQIYDTRKTTPGWRRLEKYAVRCGGGANHRTGLFDALLIKDNHLAQLALSSQTHKPTPADAVGAVGKFLDEMLPTGKSAKDMIVEIEVETLEQLRSALTAGPDIVLLDNMSPDQIGMAVAIRDGAAASVELEVSGGINLDNIQQVARTGVERISVGALTHAAVWLDISLDWIAANRAET